MLPLLEVIQQAGGALPAKQACDAVATAVGLTVEERAAQVTFGGARYNRFDRTIRFVRQRAVEAGLIEKAVRNLWALTPAGRDGLRNAQPRILITIYETENGQAVWGTAETASEILADGCASLIVTSPPYPLRKLKPYQQATATAEYIEWMLGLAGEWHRVLADDGTLVLNLGQAYEAGQPTVSLYRERIYCALQDRFGFHLTGDNYWHSRSKLPAPAPYVTINRVRLIGSVEHVYAFSKSVRPSWDTRRCLVPYSEAMQRRLAAGGERGARRPSGHSLAPGAFSKDNGGAIPRHLLDIPHTNSRGDYFDYCRAQGLPVHPARFPNELAAFFINLTTAPGDLVVDFFAGSLTVAEEAERLGRRWFVSERALTYLAGARPRLVSAPGFTDHLGAPAA